MPIQNREVTEFLLRHYILNIFHIIAHPKCYQRSLGHKMLHRDTLINQTRYRKSIVGRADNHNTLLFCFADQSRRYLRALADYQTAGVNIHRTRLCFIAVPQNNQIIFFDKLFH